MTNYIYINQKQYYIEYKLSETQKNEQQRIENWVFSENERIIEERKKIMEEKGYKEFFKFPQGTTKLTIDTSKPPRETNEGRKILRAIIDGKEWDIPVSNMLYGQLLKGLVLNKNRFEVIRIGLGKTDTRYAVNIIE